MIAHSISKTQMPLSIDGPRFIHPLSPQSGLSHTVSFRRAAHGHAPSSRSSTCQVPKAQYSDSEQPPRPRYLPTWLPSNNQRAPCSLWVSRACNRGVAGFHAPSQDGTGGSAGVSIAGGRAHGATRTAERLERVGQVTLNSKTSSNLEGTFSPEMGRMNSFINSATCCQPRALGATPRRK